MGYFWVDRVHLFLGILVGGAGVQGTDMAQVSS